MPWALRSWALMPGAWWTYEAWCSSIQVLPITMKRLLFTMMCFGALLGGGACDERVEADPLAEREDEGPERE